MIPRTIFGPEHETFRDSVRRFMDEEVKPHEERWQEQGYVEREVWRKAGANGFLCASMPEQYGGAGADRLYSIILMEEQARANSSSLGFGLHSEIVAPYLLRYGNDHIKNTYLPKMAAGEWIGAIAMSEPGAGSDLQAIKTSAVKKGDKYVVNGSKTFITNGWHCDLVIVVGSPNSSNSNRLREVARKFGVDAHRIDSASALRQEWVAGRRRIGVTAGASAPEVLVNEVVDRLKALGAARVAQLEGITENVAFTLPRGLAAKT